MLYLIFIPLVAIVFGFRVRSLRRAIIVSNYSKTKAEIFMLVVALSIMALLVFLIESF
tara:strand:+ start:155 stop:328 length:174 start_codon:yes stop_codon:yes gene_type:complete